MIRFIPASTHRTKSGSLQCFHIRLFHAALVAALASQAGCRHDSGVVTASSEQTPPKSIAVQTVHVSKKDVSRILSLPADLIPWQEATLYSKIPGTLDQLMVDKGDSVRAGQLLATIRAPEIGADAQQAEQNYKTAEQATAISKMATLKAQEETRKAKAAAEKAQADYGLAPSTTARANALLQQAKVALKRAEEQRVIAVSATAVAHADVMKAAAGQGTAEADRKLAQTTFDRYNAIYNRDKRLIARQQVDEVESRLESALSRVAAAKSDVEAARQRELAAQGQIVIADQQVQEAKAGVDAAQSQVEMSHASGIALLKQAASAGREVDVSQRQQEVARAQEKQAGLLAEAQRSARNRYAAVAEFANIRAPFSGTVTRRFVDPGAFIQSASGSQNAQPLLIVSDVSRLRLDIHVPESEARFLRPGTPVEIVQGDADAESIKMKVSRTSGVLDARSRSLLAEVDVPNSNRALIPGAYLTARITLETHPAVLSLPGAAIGSDKSGKFVFAIVEGKAKRLPITVGFDNGKLVEVSEGLKGDEEIVVSGRDGLTPGAAVTTSPWAPTKRPSGK